jgi:hypothetical protein
MCARPPQACTPFHHPLLGELDLVFKAAALRPDPSLTLLLATGAEDSPTEAALHQRSEMTAHTERPLERTLPLGPTAPIRCAAAAAARPT